MKNSVGDLDSMERINGTPVQTAPLVGIAMATYNPQLTYFIEQVNSLKNQDYQNWLCVIVDDKSDLKSFESIQEIVKGDPRFQIHQNENNMGSFKTFEKALSLLPEQAEFICFCDQDDVWVSRKLSTQLKSFENPDVTMVHTDQALIDKDGAQFADSCWKLEGRSIQQATTEMLLFRNLITGCTMMFRKEVLKTALPFSQLRPHREMYHHDMWVAMHACVHGSVIGLRDSLVLYRQHGGNLVGVSILRRSSRKMGMISRAQWAFRERYWLREDFLKSLRSHQVPDWRRESKALSYLDHPVKLAVHGFEFVFKNPRFFRTWVMLGVGYFAFHFHKQTVFKLDKAL